ncbi:hypothetical protein HaLaN_25501, partial [Haematococcus lacustris]
MEPTGATGYRTARNSRLGLTSRLGTRTFTFLVATLPFLLSHHAMRSATGGGLFEQLGLLLSALNQAHTLADPDNTISISSEGKISVAALTLQ